MGDLAGQSVSFGEARYMLDRLLGVGGMGEVYLARRMVEAGMVEWSTSDLAAIKVVRRDVAAHLGGNMKSFADEIRLHRYLSHPNIVPVRGVAEENGTLYMMMDYLEGNDLRSLLRLAREQGTRLSEGAVCTILAQVADALDYVHRATDEIGRPLHVVHRDISPSNIRITVTGEVRLMDFGVATWDAEWREATRSSWCGFKGKAPYLSPEQADRAALDGRSDLFALGTILAECLIGRHLFEGGHESLVLGVISSVSRKYVENALRGVDAGLKDICRRLLARDREARYATGKEVAAALREYAFMKKRLMLDSRTLAQEVAALVEGPPAPLPPRRRRGTGCAVPLAAILGALTLLVGCLAHVRLWPSSKG